MRVAFMTMLKLKFAVVAAVSLLGLSFEVAPGQSRWMLGRWLRRWSWFSQCPSFNPARAEPRATGWATPVVMLWATVATVADTRWATRVVMERATTVLIVVVSIGGLATQDIVAVSTGGPPMVDIVAASIGGATRPCGRI